MISLGKAEALVAAGMTGISAIGGAGYMATRPLESGPDGMGLGTTGAIAGAGIGLAGYGVVKNLDNIGEGIIKTSEYTGDALNRVAQKQGKEMEKLSNTVLDAYSKGNMSKFLSIKHNKKGFAGALLGGLGLIGAARVGEGESSNIFTQQDNINAGIQDNYVTRATPRLPDYMNNAGADGNLVFAMHRNTR